MIYMWINNSNYTIQIFYLYLTTHINAILLRIAIAEVQWAADEIILGIHHQECVDWSNDLKTIYILLPTASIDERIIYYNFDPIIPAELELLAIDVAVVVLVKDHKHLLQLIVGHHIDVALVIAEQRAANEREFGQGQQIVAAKKNWW